MASTAGISRPVVLVIALVVLVALLVFMRM